MQLKQMRINIHKSGNGSKNMATTQQLYSDNLSIIYQ